ncbi:Amidohydrolase family [Purpureocillium lavendulum]|uniref:Amidohydrolase family n=1 Tax=Purpureocillium lavendulum TaxID=1247861 RepID=A0AB34FJ66_9HYPO|nr:Amidohydrolase family [Purpureocillium lavendulum]
MFRLFSLLIVALATAVLGQQNGQPLDLTAISAKGGSSVFECWRLDARWQFPPGAHGGPVGVTLGNFTSTSYSIIPAGFSGGLHNAPSRQFVLFASGEVHITLPNSTSDAWIKGGKNGLIIAADTADVSQYGHELTAVGEDVASLQMPLMAGTDFDYQLLHPGPCH